MNYLTLIAGLAALGGMPAGSIGAQAQQLSKQSAPQEAQRMDWLAGKTIRWRFADGPVADWTFDHSFNEDGSVTWRVVDGPHQGATVREKSYAAVKVSEKVWVISYLAASGHTLTVVLNFDDHSMVGFGSNEKSRSTQTGTFELRK